ncbi:acetyl-CoA decarbonylase/synthase complex subunit alpha/beta [[Eubacterium] cellulosolvens]
MSSNKIFETVVQGAEGLIVEAGNLLDSLLREYAPEVSISFPGTIYYLPITYSLTGRKISTLEEANDEVITAKSTLKEQLDQKRVRVGQTALILSEIIEALSYLKNGKSYEKPFIGFIPDVVFRELSLGLAEGATPGVIAITGKASNTEMLKKAFQSVKEKSLICLLSGDIIYQAQELNIELGLNGNMIPLGPKATSFIHAINLILRAPLMFGNLKPGNIEEITDYVKERVPAFSISLGKLDEKAIASIYGISSLNIPVLTDQTTLAPLENVYHQTNYSQMIDKGCEIKQIKVKALEKPDIPVNYGPMYEGEKIRREGMRIEFGGRASRGFEIVRIEPEDAISDGKINVIGPNLDHLAKGSSAPLGMIIKIAGSNLEADLEPVLERRIHQFINRCEGVMHIGQRNEIWLRISKNASKKGFRVNHLGNTLHTMFHSTFPQLIEKVEIDIITDPYLVEKKLAEFQSIYTQRDERMKMLKEEEVDTFYGCVLCQSFAPNHVCVITPERISLCGSTSWLDARISYKLDSSGPNFVVPKGKCIDPVRGEWTGVNEVFKQKSHGTVERIYLHSIFGHTHTSCGCFEAIAFYIPEVNGIGIVHRAFKDPTINGMPFSTMAGFCGGGNQVEGFLGIGINYIKSDKFLRADGGIGKIVWMPMELKQRLKDTIPKDLFEKIATEHDVKDLTELKSFLKSVDHPATARW